MRTEPEDFKFFIDKIKEIPQEEVKKNSDIAFKNASAEYDDFKKAFLNGKCYLCHDRINRCDYKKPCLHWLLRRHKRIKKTHIKQILEIKDLFQVVSYLRWVAKTEGTLSQINDFEAYELRDGLIYQENIKYKKIEWTIWIKKDDLKGHKGQHTNYPHYHIQITLDGLPFVDFGNFHVPLSEWEIFNIHARRGAFPEYKYTFPHGESYLDLFSLLPEDQILEGMATAQNEDKAQFRLQSFVEAEPGKTLKGEDLQAIIEESKKTGKPLAKLAHKLGGKVKTVVTPMNLIEPKLRKKSKKGR